MWLQFIRGVVYDEYPVNLFEQPCEVPNEVLVRVIRDHDGQGVCGVGWDQPIRSRPI